jgi:hypothetical protein
MLLGELVVREVERIEAVVDEALRRWWPIRRASMS